MRPWGDMGDFQNQGYPFGGPYKTAYSILGSLHLGEVPYAVATKVLQGF